MADAETTDKYISRRMVAIFIVIALLAISFFLVKSYIAAVFTGIFLAYLFYRPYIKLDKLIKKPGVTAAIMCTLVVLIFGIAVYFIAQVTVKEAFNLYMSVQDMDIFNIIDNVLKATFHVSPEIISQIHVTLQQAAISLTNTFINSVGKILTNAPQLIIQFFITLFTFFYFLKEGKNTIQYMKEILPFDSQTNEKFVRRSKSIADATIYGNIIVGVIQGILSGLLFYIFKAPSPLFFTVLATLLGVLPFIGPWLIIVPVGLIMMAQGNIMGGMLLMIIGIIMNLFTGGPLSALLMGKKGQANPIVMLIGMLGGMAMIGPIGLIVGPLIFEYMIIFIDLYRTGKMH